MLKDLLDRETASEDIAALAELRDSRGWRLLCAYLYDRETAAIREALSYSNSESRIRFNQGVVQAFHETRERAVDEVIRIVKSRHTPKEEDQ